MQKKVVFITSGQPSINPRLVKEADTLAEAGFDVLVLYAYWNNWATVTDESFLKLKKWKYKRCGGAPQQQNHTYLLSRVLYIFFSFLYRYTQWTFLINRAIARSSFWLIKEARKQTADIYIAHNLGALPAAAIAAEANHAVFGFDAEDFHRGETNSGANSAEVLIKIAVENKYISRASYFTASSSPIAEMYQQIYPGLKPIILLNVFPDARIRSILNNFNGPIKLFWFSQTIGNNRGLDDVVKALQLLDSAHFELHLLGSNIGNEACVEQLKNTGIPLKIHEPIPPDQLIGFASQFDIGLALEPAFSTNNNIALSNKLFSYLQAGIAVIASDTLAQTNFLAQNPNIGTLYGKGNARQLATILDGYNSDRQALNSCKTNALHSAHQRYNWETERVKFLDAVNTSIAKKNDYFK